MTNSQTRLIATALGLMAGAIMSLSNNLDVNVSIVVILITGSMFLTEYVRSRKA